MTITELLSRDLIYLDGAMGTMLQKSGLQLGEKPEALGITAPNQIADTHRAYIDAGANIVYANTFGANRHKLEGCDYSVSEVVSKAIENAKSAAGKNALVALDIGPIGQLLEPIGTLSFEEAYDIFKEMVLAAKDADLVVVETMTDLLEAKAALLAAKENSDKPVFVTMTFEENLRTFTGCSVSAMAMTLEGLGADAIGFNCSLGPKDLVPLVEELARWTSLPIIVKPNAGLPNLNSNTYDIDPEEFARQVALLVRAGATIIGGCCGTTPVYICALQGISASPIVREKRTAAVCSARNTVVIARPRVIGERINPTGKKRFQQALRDHDIDFILGQASEQMEAGAEILDVNVGLPGIDETAMMVEVVKALQGITDAPLQIDSTNPAVIEAALRVYNGKAIVNSVNGEEASLDAILPIVKRYGAAVVGLTLDEKGIPKTAEERIAIAERIVARAVAIGIPKEDIFIDCLTLTASAEQAGVQETLKALSTVKERFGVKTVLGVSNISFGLPARELVNANFLTMAMTHGLDLPIINPNIASMMGAVRAYHLLMNHDENAVAFIEAYGGETPAAKPQVSGEKKAHDVPYCIAQGLKAECMTVCKALLETTDAMELVNSQLIPALDDVGKKFESGAIFLPQLIRSAEAASAGFEAVKEKLAATGAGNVEKGKIIVATVKGDIHDIGKNIVKVLLENYGYTVIDLGRDVPPQAIVDAAVKQNVPLVGLSALMTTTLGSMEETIRLLRASGHNCKIMVGGAVLTPEYAEKIGADYYAKDAKQSVDVAKTVFGE